MPPADDWVPQVQPATEGDWRSLLLHGKSRKSGERGPVLANLANAITTLRHAPEWIGVLGFNEFSLGVAAVKPTPWQDTPSNAEWTDHEDRLTADWMQHHGIMVGVETAGQAVQTVARDRPFHPVKAYIDVLQWDGTKRIDTWLSLYLGVDHSDYVSAVGARWLRSGIARIYRPGAKADCSLILDGPQGALKSTALKTLADPWFTDEIADLGTKDAALQTHGVWLIELGELGCIARVETDKVKVFMSRTTDRYRPPYGKRPIEAPRQCIFAGSVNHYVYLRDETGARRFWPVTVMLTVVFLFAATGSIEVMPGGLGLMVVGSVAVSFAVLTSPPPEMERRLKKTSGVLMLPLGWPSVKPGRVVPAQTAKNSPP
jgi:predicted P-loop ATPase